MSKLDSLSFEQEKLMFSVKEEWLDLVFLRDDKENIFFLGNEDNTEKQTFLVNGFETIEKIVPRGMSNSPRIFVPKSWEGKKVAVVRLEE